MVRYERAHPGELLHLDTKKLGRFWHVGKRITRDGIRRSPGAGWQHVHVAIDDHSRLAYAEVRPTDRQGDALAFLERARAWFRAQGIAVQAVMTDNGPAYRSHAWRQHCAAHDLRHLRTRPYTPRTNGKAERFIQILLQRWAYAFAYPSSAHRTRALIGWLRWYNRRRPHGSLDGLPPVSRVSHLRGQYTYVFLGLTRGDEVPEGEVLISGSPTGYGNDLALRTYWAGQGFQFVAGLLSHWVLIADAVATVFVWTFLIAAAWGGLSGDQPRFWRGYVGRALRRAALLATSLAAVALALLPVLAGTTGA